MPFTPSYNLFCDPTACNTLRSDPGTGFTTGNIFGCDSAILGGIPSASPTNVNCGMLSTIVMGDTNSIFCYCLNPFSRYSHIGNGCQNLIRGEFSNVFNGDRNGLSDYEQTIRNGKLNFVGDIPLSEDTYLDVYNGCCNQVSTGCNMSVMNGACNVVESASGSFIGSGCCNYVTLEPCVAAGEASIAGGFCNKINMDPGACGGGISFIGGGKGNCIETFCCFSGHASSITGGDTNLIETQWSFIGGGANNTVARFTDFSVIGGGSNNMVCCGSCTIFESASFIGAGCCNTIGICSCCSVIAGGVLNTIFDKSAMSYIGGGACNCVGTTTGTSVFGTIGGGCNNQIPSGSGCSSLHSSVIGGTGNVSAGIGTFVGGGDTNLVCTLPYGVISYSSIAGGQYNIICCNGCALPADYSFIGGGLCNHVCSPFGFVGGGQNNETLGACSSIVGGIYNGIGGNCSDFNFIGGGNANRIVGGAFFGCACYGIVFGGTCNAIDAYAPANSCFDLIGGGAKNFICTGSNHDSIFGGFCNTVSGSCNTLGGGFNNTIGSTAGITAVATLSFLGGGALITVLIPQTTHLLITLLAADKRTVWYRVSTIHQYSADMETC